MQERISACTASLRKAMDTNFQEASGVAECDDLLGKMAADLGRPSAHPAGLAEDVRAYQVLYADIYAGKHLFRQSVVQVQAMSAAKDALLVHIDSLSKIFLSSQGKEARDMAYVNGRNEVLLDRVILNAQLFLNPGTDNDKRIEHLDYMARDAVLVGEIVDAMLKGNAKLRINKVQDKRARNDLAKAAKAFVPLGDSVEALLDIAPDIYKSRLDFEDLNDLSERMARY